VPDFDFRVTGVEPAAHGLGPLLHFKLEVTNAPATQRIHSAMLQAQIQIEAARRNYDAGEKEKLVELFGAPERWGQTLRTRLWTLSSTTLRAFTGKTEAILSVPCTYDLNVSATKYFYALAGGEVALLFLFSGTVFYAAEDGRLQVEQISWEKECEFRMPARVWQQLMDHHYPNSAWLALDRETFDRLYAFKRDAGLTSWEQVIDRLLVRPESPDSIQGDRRPESSTEPIAVSPSESRS
jgi:Family of unknown function (DUF6084)